MSKRNNERPEHPPKQSRRRTLKKLGMGSAIVTLSGVWQKPVINSIVVPAHAQTTEAEPY